MHIHEMRVSVESHSINFFFTQYLKYELQENYYYIFNEVDKFFIKLSNNLVIIFKLTKTFLKFWFI